MTKGSIGVKLHARIFESLEAAFVRRKLLAIGAMRRNHHPGDNGGYSKHQAHQNKHKNREVVFKHDSPRYRSYSDAGHHNSEWPNLVPTMRLELIRPKSLPPQDSVSTNFTTSAFFRLAGTKRGNTQPPHQKLTTNSEYPSPWSQYFQHLQPFLRPRKQASILPYPASHCQSFLARLRPHRPATGW